MHRGQSISSWSLIAAKGSRTQGSTPPATDQGTIEATLTYKNRYVKLASDTDGVKQPAVKSVMQGNPPNQQQRQLINSNQVYIVAA
jgi:hypothetical protein